jgi:hypothetical protein
MSDHWRCPPTSGAAVTSDVVAERPEWGPYEHDGGWPGWAPPPEPQPGWGPPPPEPQPGWGPPQPGRGPAQPGPPPPGGAQGGWPGWGPGPGGPGVYAQGPAGLGVPPRPKGGGPRTGPLPLHPMTLSDILDGAFNLLKAELRTLMIVSAVFIVPVQLLAAFLQRDLLGGLGILDFAVDPSATDAAVESGSAGQGIALVLTLAATVLILPFVAGAVSRVVSAAYLGDRLSPGDALRAVAGRWWVFVVSWVLVHLVEGVGYLFCLLPGLLAMALFVPVAPVIAIEGAGPLRAMRRSARLVRPRMFPVLGIALLSGLLASTVGQVLGTVPTFLSLIVGLRWGWLLLAAGSIVTSLVTTPFVAIVATLVYYDGRIRQEGLDLQVMAADLARGPDPRPA